MGARSDVLEEAQGVLEEYRASLAKATDYVSRPGVMEEVWVVVPTYFDDYTTCVSRAFIPQPLCSSLLPHLKPSGRTRLQVVYLEPVSRIAVALSLGQISFPQERHF
jgi:hypothetical protein